MSNKNGSNKKVNIKGLLLFFFGFAVASIATILVLLFFVPTNKNGAVIETQTISPQQTVQAADATLVEEEKDTAAKDEESTAEETEAVAVDPDPKAEKPKEEKSKTAKSKTEKPKNTSSASAKRPSKNLTNELEVVVTGPAYLDISADMEAVIFVDGKKIRNAPLSKHSVAPGSHNIVIVPTADPINRKKFTLQAESGVRYMRNWSFTNKTWISKKP